jgi:alkylhydroperoxidase family enzyme
MMARVPYKTAADLSADDQDLLSRDYNIYRALANSPKGARQFIGLTQFLRHHSRLDGRLRELAILQVGYMTSEPYEFSHHVDVAREFGVTDEDIDAIAEETAGRQSTLEPLARAVLRAAREMTDELTISDATFAELRQDLDDEGLTDLALAIAFYNGVVRVLGALAIDVEPEFQPILERFPLPERDA